MPSSFIEKIFAPSIKITGRMKYWQKFATLAVLFTIPLSIIFTFFVIQVNENIKFTKKEIIGVEYLSPVLILLQDAQQHRGMASLYLRGDKSFSATLLEKENKIKEDFVLIYDKDKQFGEELETTKELNIIRDKWAVLEKNYLKLTPKESVEQHTEFISDVFFLVSTVGDNSNLVLDPEITSYYLMNTFVNTIPNLSENLGQARAFMISILDIQNISDLERREIINFINASLTAEKKIKRDITIALATDVSFEKNLKLPLEDLSTSIKSYTDLLTTFVDTNKIDMPLSEYYAFTTERINKNFSFLNILSGSLTNTLQRRVEILENKRQISIAVAIFSYILIAYFFAGFYLLVVRTVRELKDIAEQLVTGKAGEKLVSSNDELGDIGRSFNLIGKALVTSNNENIKRTQELNVRLASIEKTNELMINRELKMIELKKEIKELKEKII